MKMSQLIESKSSLEKFIAENWIAINEYLDDYSKDLVVPFTSSVDIRESTDKIAPVDNNIYPAGFNNLCALDADFSSEVFRKTLDKKKKDIGLIGVIPESNTKNLFYLDHLGTLVKLIRDAEYQVIILSPDQNLFEEGKNLLELVSHSGFDIPIYRAEQKGDKIFANGEEVSFLVLNNDQSSPLNLEWGLIKDFVAPSPLMGWNRRTKHGHFQAYHQVAGDFCQKFGINPNIIEAKFRIANDIDFTGKVGFEQLAAEVDALKAVLRPDSTIFVKASQGTYGMGISVVRSGEEILNMNKKMRHKMNAGKNKLKFTSALIQEGIDTIIEYDKMPAEVTIYLIGGKSVGGFMRANSEKSSSSNLNSRGMVFRKFCISEIRQNQDHKAKEALYSVVARLSAIAAGLEAKEMGI